MRACSGWPPAEETGPHSGPLPGRGGGGIARVEDGEREAWRKDACVERNV